ncbi:2-keto-4-pentenoate hydratase [Haliea sp.]
MSIETIAQKLRNSAASATAIPPIRSHLPELDVEVAYKIQSVNTKVALEAGREIVGYKIGLTSAAVQRQLGVDQPDYGVLFADMQIGDAGEIDITGLISPRIEAEVAFVLGSAIENEDFSRDELVAAIDFAVPALEIADSRIKDWDINIVDTVADNASSGRFVLGSERRLLSEIDLELCGMVLERNGEAVAHGCGAACMGNPLNAAEWLVRTMLRQGLPVAAGNIILSGALGPMVSFDARCAYRARIGGLGEVAAQAG